MATSALAACPNCMRSLATSAQSSRILPSLLGSSLSISRQQTREKSKQAKQAGTLPVRLLKDVETFGKQGAIVPVTPGQMRNEWFPRRIAEYITHVEIRKLKLKNTIFERDFEFGAKALQRVKDQAAAEAEAEEVAVRQKPVEVKKVTPDRSIELIDIFVPSKLNFFRQPIAEEEPVPKRPEEEAQNERHRSASSAAADLLAARSLAPKRKKGPQAIYGSVSTQDIVASIREALSTNEEAARVVLTEEDITFVDLVATEDNESDRVKHVGEFPIEIMVKGASQGLRRIVKVNPQDA